MVSCSPIGSAQPGPINHRPAGCQPAPQGKLTTTPTKLRSKPNSALCFQQRKNGIPRRGAALTQRKCDNATQCNQKPEKTLRRNTGLHSVVNPVEPKPNYHTNPIRPLFSTKTRDGSQLEPLLEGGEGEPNPSGKQCRSHPLQAGQDWQT